MNAPVFTDRDDSPSAGIGGHLRGETSRCLLRGETTGGRFSLTESLMQTGTEQAPLHVHSREDETFYVVEGRIEAIVGEEKRTLGPGGSVFLPRGIPHRIHTVGNQPVRLLMLLTPAGLEKFFDEINRLNAAGQLDPARTKETAARYGVTILGEAGEGGQNSGS